MELDPIQKAAQEQFARQSHRYGEGHILENTADVQAAAALIPLPEQADILDIAAATGHTGLYFARQGHHVTLADIAAPMLDRALEAALQLGLSVRTELHAAEALPYPDASFDLVTCRVAAHHFSSPAAFINESARVLRPGGHLLLIDGSVQDDAPEAEAWLHALEKWRDPSHGRFLSPRQWEGLCERAGLKVEHVKLHPFKQPDLEWYFETAATPALNREQVRELISNAPEEAKAVFRLGEEEGRIVWWWPRITLIGRKD